MMRDYGCEFHRKNTHEDKNTEVSLEFFFFFTYVRKASSRKTSFLPVVRGPKELQPAVKIPHTRAIYLISCLCLDIMVLSSHHFTSSIYLLSPSLSVRSG